MPIVQPKLKEGQSEEGDYNVTVSQAEPKMFWWNNQDEVADRNVCKYKNFMTCKPSYFTGKRPNWGYGLDI